MNLRQPWTYERVLSRCDEVGNCQIWTGSVDGGGYPQARIDGKLGRVARWVLAESLGRPIKKGMRACPKCGNPRCVAIGCLVERCQSDVMKVGLAGRTMTPLELSRRRAALIARGQAVLDMEKAREIRERDGDRSDALAAEFGVDKSTINNVRSGRTWKEVTNSVFSWRPAA